MAAFLGVGGIFGDRYATVSDLFLDENHLNKNTTNVAFTLEPVVKTWKNAGKHNNVESISLGGSCTNVIKVLARLGNKTTLISKIGPDSIGESLAMRLQMIGVETFLSKSLAPTGIVNCFITDHIRTMHTFFGGALEFNKSDLIKVKNAFFRKNHVHLEGYLIYYPDVLQESIQLAKDAHTTISLDLSSEIITNDPDLKEKLFSCIKQVDIVFGNLQEVLKLTNMENTESALSSNVFNERQIVAITNGGNGCWIKERDNPPVCIDLPPVDHVIDTTGAGDYFIAGFLDCLITKKEQLNKCVQSGHLLASYVIKEIGTNVSLEAWEDLKTRLHSI